MFANNVYHNDVMNFRMNTKNFIIDLTFQTPRGSARYMHDESPFIVLSDD